MQSIENTIADEDSQHEAANLQKRGAELAIAPKNGKYVKNVNAKTVLDDSDSQDEFGKDSGESSHEGETDTDACDFDASTEEQTTKSTEVESKNIFIQNIFIGENGRELELTSEQNAQLLERSQSQEEQLTDLEESSENDVNIAINNGFLMDQQSQPSVEQPAQPRLWDQCHLFLYNLPAAYQQSMPPPVSSKCSNVIAYKYYHLKKTCFNSITLMLLLFFRCSYATKLHSTSTVTNSK